MSSSPITIRISGQRSPRRLKRSVETTPAFTSNAKAPTGTDRRNTDRTVSSPG